MAAISGVPGLTDEMHILLPDQMVKTATWSTSSPALGAW